jgi:3-oxoacyl-[acyl-carrier protein] reductase
MKMCGYGISGNRYLITASTRGIGKGIAKVLLREGATVVINGRYVETVESAVEELRSISKNVYGIAADLTSQSEIKLLVSEAVKIMGGLNGIVYVTGPPKPGMFSDLDLKDWDQGVKLLIMSAVWLTYYAIPHITKAHGSLVYVGSVAIREPIPNIVLSNTLRIALAGLVKSLSKELGPRGIRVNLVLPGYIMTDRIKQLAEKIAKTEGISVNEAVKKLSSRVPLGRIGEPKEIGEVVAFLLSEKASYINGAAIPVDGGLLNHVF